MRRSGVPRSRPADPRRPADGSSRTRCRLWASVRARRTSSPPERTSGSRARRVVGAGHRQRRAGSAAGLRPPAHARCRRRFEEGRAGIGIILRPEIRSGPSVPNGIRISGDVQFCLGLPDGHGSKSRPAIRQGIEFRNGYRSPADEAIHQLGHISRRRPSRYIRAGSEVHSAIARSRASSASSTRPTCTSASARTAYQG